MANKKIILILAGIFAFSMAQSQKYVDGENFRVGLKAGPIASSLLGTALTKPSLNNGFTLGIYYKNKLKSGFHFQTEANATMRGARFSGNGDLGYNKFTLFYFDAAQLIIKDLKKGDHSHVAVLGVQPSILIQSWVYNPYFQMSPAARGIALNGGDVFAVFGYQYNKKIFGIQSVVKIGLTNINRGLNMYDLLGKPLGPTKNNGTITNLSWETTISF
ncbi:MAG: hypothetical protein ACKVQB_00655 [Bacteroidia bacterium]